METITPLPASISRLITTEGFIESYFEKFTPHSTCKQAYEAAEEEFYILFGKNKYASYESFRKALCCYNKKFRK